MKREHGTTVFIGSVDTNINSAIVEKLYHNPETNTSTDSEPEKVYVLDNYRRFSENYYSFTPPRKQPKTKTINKKKVKQSRRSVKQARRVNRKSR